MDLFWKRIDFGYQSIRIDYEKFEKFLHDEREDLNHVLRYWRYEMLVLAKRYLLEGDSIPERGMGRLETLLADYRRSTLHHLMSRGTGLSEFSPVHIEGEVEGDENSL